MKKVTPISKQFIQHVIVRRAGKIILLSPPLSVMIIARLPAAAAIVMVSQWKQFKSTGHLHPPNDTVGLFYFIITGMDNLYNRNPAKIVMYSTQYCPDCLRAKAFFEANNISYIPVSLEGNPAAAEFVMEMNNGFRSVPTIIFPDGTVLVEPSWQELKEKVSK